MAQPTKEEVVASTFFLRYASPCKGCGRALAVGARAHRSLIKGEGVRCVSCGPFPAAAVQTITKLPDGRARGAVSAVRPLMPKSMRRGLGIAKTTEVPDVSPVGKNRHRRRRRNPLG